MSLESSFLSFVKVSFEINPLCSLQSRTNMFLIFEKGSSRAKIKDSTIYSDRGNGYGSVKQNRLGLGKSLLELQ